jgi:glycosyltransferase involved in cell wall biosynthesis
MPKSLAGTLFVYNGKSQDYCYLEAIRCLQELCDFVIVCDAGSTDGTRERLRKLQQKVGWLALIECEKGEWESQRGKEKLNHFTNKAIEMAEFMGFDYQFNLQADEIIHEDSYPYIREAIELDQEAFQCRRINLWGSPFTRLNVPQNRLPCSEVILRLAKTHCRSYGDAESLQSGTCSMDYINKIRLYHMGFVRDRKIHPDKIRHMQKDVFLLDPDKKLEGMEVFDPWKWFDREDVIPIGEPLPKLIQKWALDRM